MPRYIADGSLDAGITGSDWIVENNVTLHQVESFIYAKATLTPSRWVLCVRNDSPVKRLEDLEGKRIATELVQFVTRILAERKVKAEVEFSWGATEAKVAEGIIDAAIDVTETGSSLARQRLAHRRGAADIESGAGRQSGGVEPTRGSRRRFASSAC